MKLTRAFALSALIGLTLTLPTRAEDLAPTLSGWFDVTGGSARFYDEEGALQDNRNYFVGGLSGFEFRNFFVFDLTGVNTLISSATLDLYNPILGIDDDNGYYGDASETFLLTSASASASQLSEVYMPWSPNGQGIFNTLGTGTGIGSVTASSDSNGRTLSISFNAAGLAYLNANRGHQVAFGGRLTTLSGDNDQFLFAYTNPAGGSPLITSSTPQVNLNLNGPSVAPEVPSLALMTPVLLMVSGTALLKNRRKKAL